MNVLYHICKKIKTATGILWREGGSVAVYKVFYKLHYGNYEADSEEARYQGWIRANEKKIYHTNKLSYEPFISVVMPLGSVNIAILKKFMKNIKKQIYKNWELCIIGDETASQDVCLYLQKYKHTRRIKVIYRKDTESILECVNRTISELSGEFIAFVDSRDILAPNAFYEMVKLLNGNKTLDFIYSDEDTLTGDGKERLRPHFKPDWSPDTLMSFLYTGQLGLYRKAIGDKIGWFQEGYGEAVFYDFILRFTEQTKCIGHIPKILYHMRQGRKTLLPNKGNKESVKADIKKVKEEALKRRGLSGQVEWMEDIRQYRAHYFVPEDAFVSVIIPSKDNFKVYKRCIDSLIRKTSKIVFEIITVDNGSTEESRQQYVDYAAQHNIHYIYHPMEFNFSAMCNLGRKYAKGNLLLLLNDDIEIIHEDWMERMAGHALVPHVGAVGAKLLYPGTTMIQHLGITNYEDGPIYSFAQMDDTPVYYCYRNKTEYNYSAVTAACLMIEKRKFDEVGGLEEKLPVAYNDVDFCFKLTEAGYYNVSRMDAVLYHHESFSRGKDILDKEKFKRLRKEKEYLYAIHPQYKGKDCFYNPNLTMKYMDCRVNYENGWCVHGKGYHVLKKKDYKMLEQGQTKRIKYMKSHKINFCLEKLLSDEREIYIQGWYILINRKGNNLYSTKVILDDGGKGYLFYTAKMYCEDVNRKAGCSGKNNLSSFRVKIEKKQLSNGNYKVYLLKRGKVCDTGQTVLVNHTD